MGARMAPLGAGTSCDAAKWCAAMAVFGLSDSLTQRNNADCLSRAGEEWANYAFITKSGAPQAPPSPLHATAATFAPDPSKVLYMNAGPSRAASYRSHQAAARRPLKGKEGVAGSSPAFTAPSGRCPRCPWLCRSGGGSRRREVSEQVRRVDLEEIDRLGQAAESPGPEAP